MKAGNIGVLTSTWRRAGRAISSWRARMSAMPSVDVFSFLGMMAVKQLHDAGIAVYGSHLVVFCDNSVRAVHHERPAERRCGRNRDAAS